MASRRRSGFWTTEHGGMPTWAIAASVAVILAIVGVVTVAPSIRGEATPYVRPTDSAPVEVVCTPTSPALTLVTAAVADDPGTVRLAVVGDSTRDAALTATLYAQLSAATGIPADNIGGFGFNGISTEAYLADPDRLQAIADFAPTLIEVSIGINDLRSDQSAPVADRLAAFVAELHALAPAAEIVLSVPAALSTIDVGGLGYVTSPDGVVNPDGAAQSITTTLRDAYLALGGALDYVYVNDVQSNITGTDADPTDPPRFLGDQLHPNAGTQELIAESVASAVRGTCN